MIISRTPFRISFFGGGTDYPVWYREHGGAVISTTIDKYCYISIRELPPFFDFKYRIRYYKTEEVSSTEEIKHNSVRECLNYLKLDAPIEMVHNADLPAQSGLGSSSTFTVGLLHALHTLNSYMPSKRELARGALTVEQDMIHEHVGSQDQTAAAFGGLNRIDFGGPEELKVRPIIMAPERYHQLQENILLFFTGFSRNAQEIAAEQIRKTPDKKRELGDMLDLVEEAQKVLTNSASPLNEFGRLLNEQWKIKRGLTHLITNQHIDEIYNAGIKAGAIGGKLCGAGNGGFILFYAPPECHKHLVKSLSHLLHVPFWFENLGSQIIYYSRESSRHVAV